MSGDPDPLYVRARAALLDAAEALTEQLEAVVLVGAQAVYIHTGDADFDADFGAVAAYTTDADFCVAPADLSDVPLLTDLLTAHGFSLGEHPGAWISPDGIPVDLMVPEALAGAGTRGARLGPHGKRVARRANGLEGALIDRNLTTITSLTRDDERSVEMLVAGPAALVVSKVHKIAERTGTSRITDKDALDILRLLRTTETASLAEDLVSLTTHRATAGITTEAASQLASLFVRPNTIGIDMAIRAAGPAADADVVSSSFTVLVSDLLTEIDGRLRDYGLQKEINAQ